ncbi:MAG: hypothetical protein KIIPBIDF_01610 [Candidatus Methanoperedenaceae archaeon GB50]|nr:MAG: hypothetical protein KIIPBIDF_01610 [Candidatus Methanoperedenaceae archaeon GB50]
MGKTLTIDPITRITGHAKIMIDLDDNGNVAETKIVIPSMAWFWRSFVLVALLKKYPGLPIVFVVSLLGIII